MSDYGSTHNSNSIADAISSKQQNSADFLAVASQLEQQEQDPVLEELIQMRSLVHGQVERIRHLEQALDQSLTSLKDLHCQIVDQQFLEAQLASTEEMSNIQQQAINRLKLQLAQQQEALDARQTKDKHQEQAFQTVLAEMEELTQLQQLELDRLRNQLTQDRLTAQAQQTSLEQKLTDFQTSSHAQQRQIADLEAQAASSRLQAADLEIQLEQAQTKVQELTQPLSDRQISLEQLETELRQAHTALQEQHDLIEQLQRSQSSPRIPPDPSFYRDLQLAQMRMEELESQNAKHLTAQAILQQGYQELEAERDRQQARLTELERQTVEMQEQILKQVQQEREYETAIQHWKDRYLNSRDLMMKLKDLLQPLLPHPPAGVAELLAKFSTGAAEIPEPGSPVLPEFSPANRTSKVDLPDFLMRRRSYKNRRS